MTLDKNKIGKKKKKKPVKPVARGEKWEER